MSNNNEINLPERRRVDTEVSELSRNSDHRSEHTELIPYNGLVMNNNDSGIQEKESRPLSWCSFLKKCFMDYVMNSNLHGLKYIGEKSTTYPEKIFWLIMFICCMVFCSIMVSKARRKWNESPVIVSFAEKSTMVWEIPFPAVTVCFETKAMQRKFNYTEYYHLYKNKRTYQHLSEEERHLFEDISMICDDHLASQCGRKFAPGRDAVKNIKKVSPNITHAFFACEWKEISGEVCKYLFAPLLTIEGLCYTFNTLGPEEIFRIENLHSDYPYLEHHDKSRSWNLEDGYGKSQPIDTYPHRGSGYGVLSGLTFILKAYGADLDYLCKGPVQGFKIILHNPAELPRVLQQFIRAPLSQEVMVAVKPKMMTTSPGLRVYDPVRRQCYFSTERYLQYFKIYTQANCEMECLSNFTYARCGCVHFGMPRGPDMNVCSSGNMKCIRESQLQLVTIEMQSSLEQTSEDSDSDTLSKIASKCKCLPSCTSIEYEAETSQSDYPWRELFKAHRFNYTERDKDEDRYYSRVKIFFKEAQFIGTRRSELYGQMDFLASCGGLLGLSMGFSILSFVEFIYMFTLRIFCKYLRQRT